MFDDNGDYLGTIEVSQDIKAIKEIKGEQRPLGWTQHVRGEMGG